MMMTTNLSQLESAESASPVITKLLGRYLAGEEASVFEFKLWEKAGLKLLNLLPPSISRQVVRLRFRATALDPEVARSITTEDLVRARLCDYDAVLEKRYPALVTGAAMGGASAHLAAVLGVPFLPQPFILGLRGGSPYDELDAHLKLTSEVARRVLRRNPDLMAIAHFDPIHDGWLTRTVSHLRFKLIALPPGYQNFIKDVLEPNGVIFYLESGAPWLQYELGERHRYQVGGWGGIPAREFIEGSDRIEEALKRAGSPHRGGWSIEGKTTREMPESEWGSEPGLAKALQAFAEAEGYNFYRIAGEDPNAFSTLAFRAHEGLYAHQGRSPQGVVIETFTQYDPGLVLRTGLIPLWLIFNTTDSLSFLKSCAGAFPANLPVFFSALVTLSRTPDMVPWDEWAQALSPFDMRNIGARPHRYPEDLVSLWAWTDRLRDQVDPGQWMTHPGQLSPGKLLDLARSMGML
jgi:hypothetical protein